MNATLPRSAAAPAHSPVIRTATETLEISQLRTVLHEQHYLKAGRPSGHVLWQGAKNLALLRNAILAIIETDRYDSLNQAFIHYADHRAEALRLIDKSAPQKPLTSRSPCYRTFPVQFFL